MAHLVREAVDLRAIAARNLVLVTKPEDVTLEKDIVTKAHAAVTANLATLKQLASEATSLKSQAADLVDAVAVFTLDANHHAVARTVRTTTPKFAGSTTRRVVPAKVAQLALV